MKPGSITARGLLLYLVISVPWLFAQELIFKGQLWTSVTAGDDPSPGRSNVEQTAGYIPSLSWSYSLGALRSIDMEAAYRWSALLDAGKREEAIETSTALYRLWGRFATESLELRLGLQKIAFGPARVLRPLMWFDTFDLKDPTGQTDGVGAARLRWFPWRNLAVWGWVIRPDYQEYASPGGRVEITFGSLETGLTYHRRVNSSLDFTGRQLLAYDDEEERFALDARWDGFVGLWTEAALTRGTKPAFDDETNSSQQVMIGGDYTLPWGKGVYITIEHLWSCSDIGRRYNEQLFDAGEMYLEGFREKLTDQASLFMVSIPWGMFDNVMGLVSYDWKNERLANFLMWQRTYDVFSLNMILYANPERVDYIPDYGMSAPEEVIEELLAALPKTLAGFGNGIQFMIVFNH